MAAVESAGGALIADEVLDFRARQLELRAKRNRARQARRTAVAPSPRPPIPPDTRALLGPPASAGTLIAEGDSWFDYPLHDVLRLLEDEYDYDVESVARRGDRMEDMAYSPDQFEELARRLEKLLRTERVPRAILLSGGGNDIAGDEFAMLLNHAASPLSPLNEDIVRGIVDVRLRAAYADIIAGLTRIAERYLHRPIPIVTHGYDYAIPDGRGFLGGFWLFPGPWLKPGFDSKGHGDRTANAAVVAEIMDRLNDMLLELSRLPEFAHVHHLDLRGTLRHDQGYKYSWANELHPTASGFKAVTSRFADLIGGLEEPSA